MILSRDSFLLRVLGWGVLVDLPCVTTLALLMLTMLPLILPSSAALLLLMTMVFRHGLMSLLTKQEMASSVP